MHPITTSGARRKAWMAARARNAARRGGLIAAVGFLAVLTTVLVLVLVPRQANRSVRARLDALPPAADTVMLLANLTGASDRLRNAEASLQALRVAYADRIASAAASATANADVNAGATANFSQPAGNVPAASSAAPLNTADTRQELSLRVARARAAPLAENFRAVGEAEFLRTDARARVLVDSLNDVSRDREAYAALSGPDARYAAMTARLTTLGQRLVILAEQRLAASVAPTSGTSGSAAEPRVNVPRAPLLDTTTLAQPQQLLGDTAVERGARAAVDSAKAQLLVAEEAMAAARGGNARLDTLRADAEADTPARVPQLAMLLAALITGLAVGYGAAFYFEVKHPRIADAAEVERVADTRVILHTGKSAGNSGSPNRREADTTLPRVIDVASEAYQLLHITLTGFGDTSREVRVVGTDAVVSATVGINLAAAAVRDSRATLLIDASVPAGTARRLLLLEGGLVESAFRPSDSDTSASRNVPVFRTRVGRDLYLETALLPAGADALSPTEWRELAKEHDFCVIVQPDTAAALRDAPLDSRDVVLCAQVGVTRLDWLTSRAEAVRANGQRVRAVLLWAAGVASAR